MHFLSEDLETYISSHSEPEPALLSELARETHLKVVQPRMMTGHYQGRILSLLSKIIRPKNILEIGTYTGYSALCLAEGLTEDGQLHTVEVNEELAYIQNKYFKKSKHGHQIKTHIGDAIEVVPKLTHTYDLIFIDGKKSDYKKYWEVVMPKTRKGTVILCDNVLWSGKILNKIEKSDKATEILQEFNRDRKIDPAIEVLILPVRDGLSLCRVL